MSFIQSLADTVVAAALQLAATSPTGAAVSGIVAYALVRLLGRRDGRPTHRT